MDSKALCRVVSRLTLGLMLLPAYALAASTGLPWEQPLQKMVDSISGPVAKAVGVLSVTMFGLMLAFSDGQPCSWACLPIWGPRGSPSMIRNGSRCCWNTSGNTTTTTCRRGRMFDLREYHKEPRQLADLLLWAGLVAPGVIVTKTGHL